jgi:hypothetical protein
MHYGILWYDTVMPQKTPPLYLPDLFWNFRIEGMRGSAANLAGSGGFKWRHSTSTVSFGVLSVLKESDRIRCFNGE